MTDYHGRPIHIYFVQPVGADGPIKIGHSTDVGARLHGLMLWSPVPLQLVASFVGSKKMERAIHRVIAADHLGREWFRPSARLAALMEGVLNHGWLAFDVQGWIDDAGAGERLRIVGGTES